MKSIAINIMRVALALVILAILFLGYVIISLFLLSKEGMSVDVYFKNPFLICILLLFICIFIGFFYGLLITNLHGKGKSYSQKGVDYLEKSSLGFLGGSLFYFLAFYFHILNYRVNEFPIFSLLILLFLLGMSLAPYILSHVLKRGLEAKQENKLTI